MGMGRYVKVTGQIGQGRYAAVHQISGEVFYPVIDKRYRDEFHVPNREKDGWCPFLFHDPESGHYLCAVYDTAPKFCKDFKCCICRIYNNLSGDFAGSVKGKTSLESSDEHLKKIWENEVTGINPDNTSEWRKNLELILNKNGYRVEFYD
ncbi:Fe-S-cluster containining protein [Methanomicrobium sp. W14]|uniref:hypothetical protein n=1 Tax=Methanomicrobium sp. W14 TaxID=2817839 RepID=UPI001AE2554F|nr:hypothetical protein [Methanomicrobium sp. W14]MBP2132844.1 Fe-S-cluster containining protein [Methanomicrobium sp. W14]